MPYQQSLQSLEATLVKLSNDKKEVLNDFPIDLSKYEKANLFYISEPVQVSNIKRIYIIITRQQVYRKYSALSKEPFELFNVEFRLWKLRRWKKMWSPLPNGIIFGVEHLPDVVNLFQSTFSSFTEIIADHLKHNDKKK